LANTGLQTLQVNKTYRSNNNVIHKSLSRNGMKNKTGRIKIESSKDNPFMISSGNGESVDGDPFFMENNE